MATAGSSKEGLELLRRERPDLLVSDIAMPDEDGYAFIRQVRSLTADTGGPTAAVALTAYARDDDRRRAARGQVPGRTWPNPSSRRNC